MRCFDCGAVVAVDTEACPKCGSTEAAEELVLPPSTDSIDAWKSLPCRIRLTWAGQQPSLAVLRRLARSGPFATTSGKILQAVRAASTVESSEITYGQAKEWLMDHNAVDGAEASVELLRNGAWQRAPEQPLVGHGR